MRTKKVVSLILTVCLILTFTGCNETTNPTQVEQGVVSEAAVTPVSTGVSVTAAGIDITNESVCWHRSNLDVTKHTLEQRVNENIQLFKLDEHSYFSFDVDARFEYTNDVNTVVICKNDIPVGLMILRDDLVDVPDYKKKWKYETKEMEFSGGRLPNDSGLDIFIDSYKMKSGLQGYGYIEITMANENDFNYFLGALSYGVSEKKYLDVEKHLMVFLVGGGTLTFDIDEGSDIYAFRDSVLEDTTTQTIHFCRDGYLYGTLTYTNSVERYSNSNMQAWWYKSGNLLFTGRNYLDEYVGDEDELEGYEDDVVTEEDKEEGQQVDGGYITTIVKDIKLEDTSIYKGQMIFTSATVTDLDDLLDHISISYAAG